MKYAITLLVFLIAIILNIMNGLDIFKSFSTIQLYENCQYLKIDMRGPEDMQQYNSTTLIIGSGNFQKLYVQNRIELEQQGIYAIINSDQLNFQVIQLKTIGYPKNIALNIHGIYLRKQKNGDYLYLINHAYKYGGERIEIFQINELLDLTYQHSILMSHNYTGILNDLIVVDDNRLLTTMYMPLPDPIEGRSSMSIWQLVYTLFILLVKSKQTYVIDCRFEATNVLINPQCKEIKETAGIMLNGITWNKFNTIWVADSAQKGFSEYLIKDDSLQFSRFLDTATRIDNIEFQEQKNTLIFGQSLKFYGFFQLLSFMKSIDLQRDTEFEYWGALSQFNLTSNQFEILVQNQNLSKGISGGLVSGRNLFISSWCDISVMVCQKI